MASTFFERIDHLAREVGEGKLIGKVRVNQVYAKYQELRDDLNHPDGGQAHYLRDTLFEGNSGRMQKLAGQAITPDGSHLKDGMVDAAEDISQGVFDRAPVEFGDLKASGHPIVIDNGAVIYDRAPNVHRLTKSELRAKGRVRSLFRFERGT